MNDLMMMMQLIEDFAEVDKKISSIAEKKMHLHLWYLSEDLAALPLFSEDIRNDDKRAIGCALQREPFSELLVNALGRHVSSQLTDERIFDVHKQLLMTLDIGNS